MCFMMATGKAAVIRIPHSHIDLRKGTLTLDRLPHFTAIVCSYRLGIAQYPG